MRVSRKSTAPSGSTTVERVVSVQRLLLVVVAIALGALTSLAVRQLETERCRRHRSTDKPGKFESAHEVG